MWLYSESIKWIYYKKNVYQIMFLVECSKTQRLILRYINIISLYSVKVQNVWKNTLKRITESFAAKFWFQIMTGGWLRLSERGQGGSHMYSRDKMKNQVNAQ